MSLQASSLPSLSELISLPSSSLTNSTPLHTSSSMISTNLDSHTDINDLLLNLELDELLVSLNDVPTYTIFLFHLYNNNKYDIQMTEVPPNCFLHFILSNYHYQEKNELLLPSSNIEKDDRLTIETIMKVYKYLPSNIFNTTTTQGSSNLLTTQESTVTTQYNFKFKYHTIPYPTMKIRECLKDEKVFYVECSLNNNVCSPFSSSTKKTVTTSNHHPPPKFNTTTTRKFISKAERYTSRLSNKKKNNKSSCQHKMTQYFNCKK